MPGYKEIADIIENEIAAGKIALGEHIPSRREICEIFHVSNVTAFRVHKELQSRNLVLSIPGAGNKVFGPFIPPGGRQKICPLKKVVAVGSSRNFQAAPLFQMSGFWKEWADAQNLELEFVYGEVVPVRSFGNFFRNPDPSVGYILSYQAMSEKLPCLSHLLAFSPMIHTVLIEAVVPYSYCVLYDYYQGMELLVQSVYERGGRNVLYPDHFYSLSNENAAEKRYGCELACRRRGMNFHVIDSGDYNDIAAAVRSSGKFDAVMCPQDAVAVRVKQALTEAGIAEKDLPLITGCDCDSLLPGAEEFVSVRYDMRQMAETAWDLLLHKPLQPVIYDIVKIPGKLVPAGGRRHEK